MKKFITITLAVSAVLLNAGTASAQSAGDCTCIAPAGSTGQVVNTTPGANYAGAQGPQPVSVGTAVSDGTVISVGPAANVGGQFGPACTWSAGASSVVTVSPLGNGQLCLRIEQTEAFLSAPTNSALLAVLASSPGWIPLLFDDDDDDGPVSF